MYVTTSPAMESMLCATMWNASPRTEWITDNRVPCELQVHVSVAKSVNVLEAERDNSIELAC